MVADVQVRPAQGAALPAFLYGTAWKEERTLALTTLALHAGFRAVDTANQRKHYFESAVGEAVKAFLASGKCARADLFLQSKFTHLAGQDHRLPYDSRAPVADQVAQSLASSLEHFATSYLDAYLLHGPSSPYDLTDEDWQAWQAMEALALAGKIRLIGISNVSPEQLAVLQKHAKVKPAFVQNRCYARAGWDREVRAVAVANAIAYQGFSLLTANVRALQSRTITAIAAEHRCTPAQLVFRFARAVGMIPITGTCHGEHMREDLAALAVELAPDEVTRIEQVGP